MRLGDWILGLSYGVMLISLMAVAEGQFFPSSILPVADMREERFEDQMTWGIADAGEAAQRDRKKVTAFRKTHPCPATGITSGACPGWVVDHIVPLCWDGADEPANMQWQEKAVSIIKDKFEREACMMKRKSRG